MGEPGRPVALALLVVCAVVPFLPAVTGEFVYDDRRFVETNAALDDAGLVSRVFTDPTTVTDARVGPDWKGIYRPLRTLSFALDRRLGGSPWISHVQNLAWHVLASILAWLLLRRLLGNGWTALLGAAVFAVHPAQVESVAWITSRGDVMAGALTLLALLLAMREGFLAMAALPVLAAALLAKESAMAAPLLLLVLLGTRQRKLGRGRSIGLVVSFLAVTIAYGLVRTAVLAAAGDESVSHGPGRWGGSLLGAVLTMARGAVHYFQTLLLPGNLMIDHHVPQPAPGTWPLDAALLLVVLIGLTGLGALSWWRGGAFGLGWVWLLAALAPVSNLAVTIGIPTADRFLYLPMLGFAILVGAAVGALARRAPRRLVAVGAVVVVLLLGALSAHRAADWRTEDDLWGTSLHDPATGHPRGTKTSYRAPFHFAARASEAAEDILFDVPGGGLDDPAEKGTAETLLREARRLSERAIGAEERYGRRPGGPAWPQGVALLALTELQLSLRFGEDLWLAALDHAETAARTSGDRFAPGHARLGQVAYHLGQLDRAAVSFQRARELAPHVPDHTRNLVKTLNLMAAQAFRENARESRIRALGLALRSEALTAHVGIQPDARRIKEAIQEEYTADLERAREIVRQLGEAPEASFVLAQVHCRFGQFGLAKPLLDRLLRERGNDPELRYGMALFFYQLQGERDPQAYEHAYGIYASLEREGKLRPSGRIEMARCLLRLAERTAEEGRFEGALELCGRADPLLGDDAGASFERFAILGDVRQQAAILHDLLDHAAAREDALRASSEAYTRAEEHAVGSRQTVWEQARLARRHGRVLEALDDDLGALRRYRRALLVLDDQEFPDRRWLEAKVRALE